MHTLPFPGDDYDSPSSATRFGSWFPTMNFYFKSLLVVKKACDLAKAGKYTDDGWVTSSLGIVDSLESSGVRIRVEGMEHFKNLDGPCVFVGNHMSTLETFVLPGIIQPYKAVTFVVKRSLVEYPFFKYVMRSRGPVVVDRQDPRADFATVMEEGCKRLAAGTSIIIFPQSTRALGLDPSKFNSLGIKLARKAGVPVVPVALRTDAWGINTWSKAIKDYGPIRPDLLVHFRFGKPLTVTGNGKTEHQNVVDFICASLAEWGLPALPPGSNGTLPA